MCFMLLLSTLGYQAALLRQQREDRRRARLLEVREQERNFAKKIRVNVRTKKQEERRAMEEQLQAVLAASQEAELRELEAHYQTRRKQIGQGHRQAQHVAQVKERLHCYSCNQLLSSMLSPTSQSAHSICRFQ